MNPATGKFTTQVELSGTAIGRARCSGTLTVTSSDGSVSETPPPTVGEAAVKLAESNENFQHVLKKYGESSETWVGLYIVLVLNEARFKRAIATKKLEMPLNTWFAGKWII
jgi:hypothetical protein